MSRRSKNLPAVEQLEAVELLTGLTAISNPPAAAAAPIVSAIPIPIIVGLNGQTHGSYSSQVRIPDTGTIYDLQTTGKFHGYGQATVTGTLHTTGFTATGRAFGTLKVVLPQGTLTLTLTGPTQPGFSPLPNTFSFVISNGTGKFHNKVGDPVGRGTVTVTLVPPLTPSSQHQAGGVTLAFHSVPVAIE